MDVPFESHIEISGFLGSESLQCGVGGYNTM